MDYNIIRQKLVEDLRNFLGDKNAIIGISGGIDSAVVASLCVRAVGNGNVIGIQMPYGDQSTKDGSALVENLGIQDHVINIKHIVQSFPQILPSIDSNAAINRLTNGNIRARVRMTLLYAYAGSSNGMVIGTSNKTETLLGYFTKFGDGGCDVEPIGNLYKTEIFELAKELGDIPDSIINKKPSAELWEGQTDEAEIGMTYVEMDGILSGMFRGLGSGIFKGINSKENCYHRNELIKIYGESKVSIIEKRVKESAHKREMPKTFFI